MQVAGDPGTAPLDKVLGQLAPLQEKIKTMGGGVGKAPSVDPSLQNVINDLTRDLRSTAASLPQPLDGLVKDVAGGVEAIALKDVRVDLVNQYTEDVATECRDLVGDAYPLNAGASKEVKPLDFGRVFGYDGVFDRFFAKVLEPMVDTTRKPWTWRPTIANASAGPAWMLRQFEDARSIRDNFFRPGSQKLELTFRVSPVELDGHLNKFVLQIDGQSFEYQFGPERPVTMTWPGMVGEASFTFYDRSSVPPSSSIKGDWALFKLLDEQLMESESETRHVVTFRKNAYTAKVRFEAESNRNPFYRRELLHRFRCQN
jgi:type VI secretion system protein ImpL